MKAVFESWRGRYNDSPRVISEALGTAAPQMSRIWVSSNHEAFPPDVELVPRHSMRHFIHLAGCDLLVTNDIVTRHYVKGPKVVYLQTWHGSPIKVIGHDEAAPKYRKGKAHLRKTRRDVAKWDYLLSPSRAYSKIFREAFGFEGEILEFGYPRNDVLVNDDGALRRAVRADLGVSDAPLVVLYAPTWRDDAHVAGGGFYQPELIDWSALFSGLPEGSVVLNRLHQHVAADRRAFDHAGLVDVSRYENITDLILASDALISDYSSIVYDYAVFGRPIVLHAPDLAHYRDNLRNFYFDYEAWAPGPVTSSTAELVDVLCDLPAVSAGFADHYAEFKTRYCSFDDGQASDRVVALLQERHLS